MDQALTPSALGCADFSNERLTLQPDTENVPSCVHVAIMRATAVRANPASYSKTCDTFRAADCAAIGTSLGRPPFIGFYISRSVPAGLIAELIAEHGPTGIRDGLSHLGLLEFFRVHIADDDQFVLSNNPRGLLMQMVATSVGDLGIDRRCPAPVPSALSSRECSLIFAVVPQGRNCAAVATSRKRLEAEIDSNAPAADRQVIWDFALKRNVPAATGILAERAVLQNSTRFARLPKAKSVLEVNCCVPINLRAPGNERHPSKRAARPSTRSEARTSAVSVTTGDKLPTYGGHRIAMQAKVRGGTRAQPDQIECPGPLHRLTSPPSRLSLALNLTTVVPDEINRASVAIKTLAGRGVFDSIFEGEDHGYTK
jgi:hypothetical protein